MICKLSEVITDIAAGPFGSNLKVECFVNDGFPIIDGANLNGFTVEDNITKFVTEEKARSLHRSIARRGDVIVTISGNVGQISYIPENSKYEEYLCSQRQFRVTFDTRRVCVPWLVYFFHSRLGQHLILQFANQVGVPALSQPLKNFRNIQIDLPDLETQRKIVRILSALDQKIELNNQESENLHKIIKTLYRNTASSIKEKTKLADLAKISSGKRPTCIETNGKYAVVGARDVMGFTNEYNQEPEVIITGRVGTLGVVKRYPKKTWASDNTLIVDTRYKNYIEYYLSSVDFSAYNRGSTQPLITQTDLKNFVLPFDKEKCDSFEDKTASLRNKMFALEEQNKDLIMLRDTLLPKLMSGTIDLDKVMTDE